MFRNSCQRGAVVFSSTGPNSCDRTDYRTRKFPPGSYGRIGWTLIVILIDRKKISGK